MSHTMAVNGAQESAGEIRGFPGSLVAVTGEPEARVRWVKGLAETLNGCFEEGTLPAETGAEWAVPGKRVDLKGYRFFPSA